MNALITLGLLSTSFLLGSIPTGYLLLKGLRQQDIRDIGSGNIGSTNVRRAAGPWLSLLTQIIDILKGLIPVGIGIAFRPLLDFGSDHTAILSAVALASILGHDFSPFMGFRGGKGVNTTAGAFLLLAPISVLAAAGIFYALRVVTPVVSVRSLALGFTVPLMSTLLGLPAAVMVSSWIAAFLIVFRHVSNIRRLIDHSELE